MVEEFSFVSDGNRSGSAPSVQKNEEPTIGDDFSDEPIDLSDIPF